MKKFINIGNNSNFQTIRPELNPVAIDEQIDVIHGTFLKYWIKIKNEGISRMNRNHIHLATGLPYDKGVISGIRHSADVFIYINLKLAISEGLQFYRSINQVILTPGDENGFIRPKYFLKVCDEKGQLLAKN